MKIFKITLVLLSFCQAVIAQQVSAEEIAEKRVIRLDEKVSLTEVQKTEINAIYLASSTQIIELRKEKTNNQEAIKQVRLDERAKIKEVLSEEQQKAPKEAQKAQRIENKEARENIKSFNKEHVKPVVSEKRKSFDLLLSQSEKETIAAAQKLKSQHKEHHKKSMTPAEKAVAKSNRDEIRTLLNPIVEAHKDELDSIKMELKPVYDAAKQHATNQKETNVKSEMRKNKDYSKKGHKTNHNNHFAYRFLLSK